MVYPILPTVIPQIIGGGSDDHVALQNAIDKADSTGIGHVTLPPQGAANPIFTGSTLLLPSNMELCLPGPSCILKLKNGANVDMIRNSDQVAGNSNIRIRGGGIIDGNKANQNGDASKIGINLTYIQGHLVEDLEIRNVDGKAVYQDGAAQRIGPGRLRHLWVHDNNHIGVQHSNSQRRDTIEDILSENNLGAGVMLDASEFIANNLYARYNGASATLVYTAGIEMRNIWGANIGLLSSMFNYRHGVDCGGLVDSVGGNWVVQGNGQATDNTFDEMHFRQNDINPGGYGENSDFALGVLRVGFPVAANPGTTVNNYARWAIYYGDESNTRIKAGVIQFGKTRSGLVRKPTNVGSLVVDGIGIGRVSGRYYPTFKGNITTATSVPTLDTRIYLYPFKLEEAMSPASLAIHVITGGSAGSACKIGIWNNGANGRATGLPISGLVSNTAQDCTGSASNPSIAATGTLEPGVWYWAGVAFTTSSPQAISIAGTVMELEAIIGRASPGTVLLGCFSAAYTYSTDITTLDLTSAVFTELNAPGGNPVLYLVAP